MEKSKRSLSLQDLGQQLKDAGSVTLLSHLRPDGDAYGSMLGLAHALQAHGVSTHLYNQDGLLPMYAFLPGSENVIRTPVNPPETGVVVSLDTSTEERLGPSFLSWKRKVDINIDHHVSNTLYGTYNLIKPELPATSSIILQLIQESALPLGKDAAACLFVGLSTDTGSFRHRGTSSTTFRQAASLVEAGADCAELSRQCYQSMSLQRFALLRLAFQSLVVDCHGKMAYYVLTPEMFSESGAKPEDTEGIVETTLNVDTILVGALFEIKEDNSLKVSLRSKGTVDVSKIALEFGGGGHPGAAGINFSTDGKSYIQKVLARLRQALN